MSKEIRHNTMYENEFPTLSETSANSEVKVAVDSVSYSAKLRKSSLEKIGNEGNKLSKISSSKRGNFSSLNINNEASVTSSYKNIKMLHSSNKNASENLCNNMLKPNKMFSKFETKKQNDVETGWTIVGKKGVSSPKNDNSYEYDSRVEIHAAAAASYNSFPNKPSSSYLGQENHNKSMSKKNFDVNPSKIMFKNQNAICLTRNKKPNAKQNEMKNSTECKQDFQLQFSSLKSFHNFSETKHASMLKENSCYADNKKNAMKTSTFVKDSKNQSNVYVKEETTNQYYMKGDKKNISQENKSSRLKSSEFASGKNNAVRNQEPSKRIGKDTKSNLHQIGESTVNAGFKSIQKCEQSSLPDKNCPLSQKKLFKTMNDKTEDAGLNPFKSNKKKRKSKIKRQAAFQSNKIQMISADIHRKILNLNKMEVDLSQKVMSNIYDSEEYPELNKAVSIRKANNTDDFSLTRKLKDISNDEVAKADSYVRRTDQSISQISSDDTMLGKFCESTEKVHESAEHEKVPVHSNNPISVSLFDMLWANKSKKKKSPEKSKFAAEHSLPQAQNKKPRMNHQTVNPLDSSKPAIKRGKEREKPKLKKPSLLKRIILLDRERRKARLLYKYEPKEIKQNKIDFFNENAEQSQKVQALEVRFSSLESCCKSIDNFLEDIRWLFGLHGKCFHRISRTKCTICYENEIIEDDILLSLSFLFKIEKQASFYKKIQNVQDLVLSDIRRLYETYPKAKHSSDELFDHFMADIKYLFNEQQYSELNSSENAVSLDENIFNNHSDSSKINDASVPNGVAKIENMAEKLMTDISLKSNKKTDILQDLINSESPNKELLIASQVIIHSKKFREYCNHFLDKDLEEAVFALIDDLARFQDRMHQKDPVKARMKRRLLYGIREIKRHIKLKKLKCIIIACDIENSGSEGGLNDNINELKTLARDFQIPCVFALQRRKLGRVCRKPTPVSAVGVINYEGSEANFKKILTIQNECKMDYDKVIKSLPSSLTDEQAALLFKTKGENSGDLHSVIMTLLKGIFPKPIHNPKDSILNACGEKNCQEDKEKWEFILRDTNKICDLTDMISLMNENNTNVNNNEQNTYSQYEMYNILTKYKIINY